MQWSFVVLGLLAALAEMHTGTVYLAGVAAAAFLTAGLAFWLPDTWTIVAFAVFCTGIALAVKHAGSSRGGRKSLADFDVGQTVSVTAVAGPDRRITVVYRGAEWNAVMDDDSAVAPGDVAVIARKTDKQLHLVRP